MASTQPDPKPVAAAGESRRLQMADIARLAGVSVATVSRALNGSALVNQETRDRIAELAHSLNYSINEGAKNLRLKHNRTVAVIVPYDPATRQPLSDPFFLALIGSLADALTDRGCDMLLSRVDADRLDLAAQFFATGRAMGIVLIGQWHHHDQLNAMAVRGIPFMVWGAQLPGQLYGTVGSDNLVGGQLATEHLLDRGATRIAFLGDPELPEIGQRHAGYLRAHRLRGLTPDPRLLKPTPFVTSAVRDAALALHAEGLGPDGLFAASDLTAMTAAATLRSVGVRVPEDLLVVGYDDIELAAHFHPPLSTIRQPIAEAGRVLVELLLAQTNGQRARSQLLGTELVARASTNPG
jgi:DNA-binding LacI/PurR family transcriptional regulator